MAAGYRARARVFVCVRMRARVCVCVSRYPSSFAVGFSDLVLTFTHVSHPSPPCLPPARAMGHAKRMACVCESQVWEDALVCWRLTAREPGALLAALASIFVCPFACLSACMHVCLFTCLTLASPVEPVRVNSMRFLRGIVLAIPGFVLWACPVVF